MDELNQHSFLHSWQKAARFFRIQSREYPELSAMFDLLRDLQAHGYEDRLYVFLLGVNVWLLLSETASLADPAIHIGLIEDETFVIHLRMGERLIRLDMKGTSATSEFRSLLEILISQEGRTYSDEASESD